MPLSDLIVNSKRYPPATVYAIIKAESGKGLKNPAG